MRCATHMGAYFTGQLGDASTAPSFVCRDRLGIIFRDEVERAELKETGCEMRLLCEDHPDRAERGEHV